MMTTIKRLRSSTLLLPLFLAGCSVGGNGTYSSNDFSCYYSASGKGIEVYCWKLNDSWFTGLLPGTNRFKTVEEIKMIQTKPCPIYTMREILTTYPKEDTDYAFVCIVSVPPLESELHHGSVNTPDAIASYKEVYGLLDLSFPEW